MRGGTGKLEIGFARQRDLLVGDHGEAVSARMPILPLDLDSHDLSALAMKEARAPQDLARLRRDADQFDRGEPAL